MSPLRSALNTYVQRGAPVDYINNNFLSTEALEAAITNSFHLAET